MSQIIVMWCLKGTLDLKIDFFIVLFQEGILQGSVLYHQFDKFDKNINLLKI